MCYTYDVLLRMSICFYKMKWTILEIRESEILCHTPLLLEVWSIFLKISSGIFTAEEILVERYEFQSVLVLKN